MANIPEALFTDLDGSLLNDDKEIGAKDVETLKKLKALGVKVFLATGRHFPVTRYYAKIVGTEYPSLTCNGAEIFDYNTEEPLYYDVLPMDAVKELTELARREGVTYYYYTKNRVVTANSADAFSFYHRIIKTTSTVKEGELVALDGVLEIPDEPVIKFIISDCPPETYVKVLECKCVKDKVAKAAFSGERFLDVNKFGSNKGSAIAKIADDFGFSLKNTIALGDNFNDEEMLSVVGYPCVPETARPEVKDFAKFITCSNNDNPITYIIEHLFPDLLA